MSSLQQLCSNYDKLTNAPVITTKHASASDYADTISVAKTVLDKQLLDPQASARHHKAFKNISVNPLHKLDLNKIEQWIITKQMQHALYDKMAHKN